MRISTTRIEVAVFALVLLMLIALAVAPACWGSAFGREVRLSTQPDTTTRARRIADGEKGTIEGIVIKSDGERFTVRQPDGTQTEVIVTDKTEIKTVRKGLFRSDKISSANQIVRGLRLTVEGSGNGDGQIVARKIRFDEQDLHTAQSLESRVDATNQSGEEKTAVVQLTDLP